MMVLSTQISQEILKYADLEHIDVEGIDFTGIPVAHNLCFPIDEIISGVQGACGKLIAEIWKLKTGEEQAVKIDLFHSYLTLSSTLFVTQNGYPIYTWESTYPTIGLYKTKDGRDIFVHGGHPALRDKILKVLEAPNDKDYIAAAIQKWDALELEEAITHAAGCAAVVREKGEWLNHPQGKILQEKPPLVINKLGDSQAEAFPDGTRPLSGLKVVDMTHVLAAPYCGRVMAEFGADVLHISAPHLPNVPPFSMDTGHGKRQAFADLRRPEDLTQLKKLISGADVFIEGWRPHVMKKYGLSPEEVQEIRPGIVHITLSCYGTEGPWKDQAGWEQIAQTVSGIVDSNSYMIPIGDKTTRKVLDTINTHGLFICDYLSGNLGAIAILASLIKRHRGGGGYHTHIALSRTGMWVMSKTATEHLQRRPLQLPLSRPEYELYLSHSQGPFGRVEYLLPAIQLSKTSPAFVLPVAPLGSGKMEWLE